MGRPGASDYSNIARRENGLDDRSSEDRLHENGRRGRDVEGGHRDGVDVRLRETGRKMAPGCQCHHVQTVAMVPRNALVAAGSAPAWHLLTRGNAHILTKRFRVCSV